MLKALIKKQLFEFLSGFLTGDKKKNIKSTKKKQNTPISTVIGLFAVFMLVFSTMFFGMAHLLIESAQGENVWIYFSLFGVVASLLGIVGSVFLAYNSLYCAKDNDLLLSMPIPPRMLLFSRMLGIYLIAFVFEAIVLIPSVIVYILFYGVPNILGLLTCLINVIVLPLWSVSISCVLGWLIALASSKIRNKNIITIVFSIAFFAVYYVFLFRFNSVITKISENIVLVGDVIKKYLYPLYALGKGNSGEILYYLLFLGLTAVVFLAVYCVLSKNFIRLATANKSSAKKKYIEKTTKLASMKKAFLKKELMYIFNSPIYLLNCSMGSILLILVSVVCVFKSSSLDLAFSQANLPGNILVLLVCVIGCFLSSSNYITAPSISLESKNLWLLKSVPINVKDIFFGKIMMHIIITTVPMIIFNVVGKIVFNLDIIDFVISIIVSAVFTTLCALFGLIINLNFPKLDWTNETVPIKQSMSTFVCMLFGFFVLLLSGAICYLLLNILPATIILLIFAVLFAIADIVLWKHIAKKGVEKFKSM